MAIRRKKPAKAAAKTADAQPSMKMIQEEVREVEAYEYLLVEYLKEISNELTYLILIVAALFLFVLIDIIPSFVPTGEAIGAGSYEMIRTVFILLIVLGFALFGISNITKRKIEKKFEMIFKRY